MNMIEKIARAIDDKANEWSSESGEPPWDMPYELMAMAVLTALSEPTQDMLNAAVDATDAGGGMSWVNRSPQKLFEQGWQAMLAAASKD